MKGEVGSLKESQSFLYRITNGVLVVLQSDRCSSDPLETVVEHFVAPNAVLGSPLSLSQWKRD